MFSELISSNCNTSQFSEAWDKILSENKVDVVITKTGNKYYVLDFDKWRFMRVNEAMDANFRIIKNLIITDGQIESIYQITSDRKLR